MAGPLLAALALLAAPQNPELDAAFEVWWAAPGAEARVAAAPRILAAGASFEELQARLARGREYSADVPRGKLLGSREIDGVRHGWMAFVPESYDPAQPQFVRFDLHGGMGQPEWKEVDGSWSPGWAAVEEYRSEGITILPAGWWDSMWWEHSQVRNFRALLDEFKRTYNVDENRIAFVGGSDGGVAAWFYAMRWADSWAAYFASVSHPARLTSVELRADGQLHPSNLDGQRIFAINGVRDRIISIRVIRKYVELFRERTTLELDYREHAKDGHDLRLTDEEEGDFVRFILRARRDPLPDRLTWATERTDRYARRAWLVIDELDPDHPVDEDGILPRFYGPNVPRTKPPTPRPFGQVTLERDGNEVHATAVGVRRFRLLVSPQEFDLARPIRVVVDGVERWNARVEPDPAVLLRWAAEDDDRTRQFAAEIAVTLPGDDD